MSTAYILILLALWSAILVYLTVIMLIALRSPSDTPHLHATKRAFLTRMLITFWLVFTASAVLLLTYGGPFQFYGISVFLVLVIVVRIWRRRFLRRYPKS
jgi:hypothetical protein